MVNNVFSGECTISGFVNWASNILREHGVDSPRLDAEIILAYLMGCRCIDLYTHPARDVGENVVVSYKKAIQRRAQRVPLQYITNHAEFMSLDFYVDERVLIPRPETELLVEAVIRKSQILSKEREIVIVDIGGGSGNRS